MRSKVERHSEEAEKTIRDIRRAICRQYSAEEKVRIVIAGLRAEDRSARAQDAHLLNPDFHLPRFHTFASAGQPPSGLLEYLLLGAFLRRHRSFHLEHWVRLLCARGRRR